MAAAVVALTPATGRAQDGTPLDRAREAYQQGLFEEAIEILREVEPPPGRAARIEYLMLRGMVAFALVDLAPDALAEARSAFTALLRIDPDVQLPPGSSPRLAGFLARLQSEGALGRPAVRLRLLPAEPGRRDRLRIGMEGEVDRVDAVLVWLRQADGTYEPATTHCTQHQCVVEVPPPLRQASLVEGYAVAHDHELSWLGGLGRADAPFTYVQSASPEDDGSILGEPLLWAAVGGATIVAVVVGVLVSSGPQFQCPAGVTCEDLP